jgi:hypothetical protein
MDYCPKCGHSFKESELVEKGENPISGSTVKKDQDLSLDNANENNSGKGCGIALIILLVTIFMCFILGQLKDNSDPCAKQRIDELKRRTRLEQQGIDTGPSDPLLTPCK